MIEFDVTNILLTVGIPAPPFPYVPFARDKKPAKDFPLELEKQTQNRVRQNGRQETSLTGTNVLGQRVFMPAFIALEDGSQHEIQCPLITISGQKTIVETSLVNQPGTVKEFINIQDYSIRIVSTIINRYGTYPEGVVYEFAKLIAINKVLTLKCALTDLFLQAKDNVVVTGFNTPDMQGIINAQVLEINLKSNWYYELELT